MFTRLRTLLASDGRWLFPIVLFASVVPIWLTHYLPLVDVPQHAAPVASLHEIGRGNPFFTATFEVNWFTPYLVGYLLLFAVSSFLPIGIATKVVLSVALIAFPWMTGVLLRETGADPRLKWLAVPASFSFAFYWGFFVYVVAIPIAIGLFVLTVRYERRPTLRSGLQIAAFSIFLFFSHVVALGIASVLSLTYLLARNLKTLRRFAVCALPYTAPLPLIALWLTHTYATETSVRETPVVFAGLHARLITLFVQLAGMDGFGFAFAVIAIVVITILLLPFAAGYTFATRPERWLPLAVGVLIYFTFPSYALGTAFLYQRLAVFLIPLWLIAWAAPARVARMFGPVVIVVTMLWCAVNVVRFAEFGREAEGFGAVLSRAEPGRRVAGMLVCNTSPYFSNPVYLHFAAWYQAESAGVADRSFAATHPSMVRYRDLSRARLGELLAVEPMRFSWTRDGGDSYDYYLVCAGSDISPLLFKERRASVDLVIQQGSWWLYRNVQAPR